MRNESSAHARPDRRSIRLTPSRGITALILSLLLVAAACGDGGDRPSASTTQTSGAETTETTAAKDPVAPDDERSLYGVDLSALELPPADAYDEYDLYEDDTAEVEVEVPSAWGDVDTRLATRDDVEVPGVWASTDLEALGTGYSAPGVQVDLRTASSEDRLIDLLNTDNATEDVCSGPERFDYDDGLYTGTAELWTGCTDDGTALLQLVALRAGNQYVTVEVQMRTDADVDAALRVLETFAAIQPEVGEEWDTTDSATARTGEVFTVVVQNNPSVGDDWGVGSTHDPEVVEYLYEDYESSDPTGLEAGAGGTSYFSFRALAPGSTTITLENCFQCDPDGGEVTETASLDVTVEP